METGCFPEINGLPNIKSKDSSRDCHLQEEKKTVEQPPSTDGGDSDVDSLDHEDLSPMETVESVTQ